MAHFIFFFFCAVFVLFTCANFDHLNVRLRALAVIVMILLNIVVDVQVLAAWH
jgi:hypothetical protein